LCEEGCCFYGIINDYYVSIILSASIRGGLADDIFGAVGKGLVNEIVSIAGGAFNGHKDITICDRAGINTNISSVV
jgi:hypothetical protein